MRYFQTNTDNANQLSEQLRWQLSEQLRWQLNWKLFVQLDGRLSKKL